MSFAPPAQAQLGRQLDETLSIPTSVLPWSRSSQLSSDQSAPKRLPSSSPRLNLSSPPQSHSSNNSPSSRPLVWRLIRALPGNPFGSHYQAYSRRRYPRQYYIVTRMPTPWNHSPLDEIPVFKENQDTPEDICCGPDYPWEPTTSCSTLVKA